MTIAMIRREFLGWDRPALTEAARRLGASYRQGRTLDLGRVIVVVPGQRAGRRLLELLAWHAEDEKLRLTPPEVVTEGRLPEKLYLPKQPFANEFVQDLAWAQALRDLPVEARQYVVPYPPAGAESLRWLELGKVLRRLHIEMAADGLDFAAVERMGPRLADFSEARRWQALVMVQRRYLELLDAEQLWDIQTARLKAIEFQEIRTDRDIILLGTVDLNNTLRQMLDMVAAHVTAYLVAPENRADHFDAHGCLVPKAWCEALIPLRDDQLCQVDGPIEQADAVSGWLAELGGRFRTDEVVIGVPDEALVCQLQRQLEESDVKARWVEGVRLGETGPYRLLAAALRFAGRRRYTDLAALLRHPDLEDWLQKATTQQSGSAHDTVSARSLPAQLDLFYNKHFPSRISSGPALTNGRSWPGLAPALECIDAWLADASASRPLRAWGEVVREILSAVYGERTLHVDEPADDVLHKTMCRIVEECDRLGALPEALDTATWPAADFFEFAPGPLAKVYLPPPADPNAVEILGWLELPLDDAPALIVTSFNEGFVPQSTGADAFLPDRLRQELGLLHNERRYARDAYATSVLCQARAELRVLLARRDTRKDPLQPSRLLFACPDAALVERARDFFGKSKKPPASRRVPLSPGVPATPERSLFEVPVPVQSGEKLERMSVTRFKDYLACPYRYYLRHVQKLEAIDDTARELDGGEFGTMLHGVLGAFGRNAGGPRHAEREKDILDYVNELLSAHAAKVFGPAQHRPAIRLQLEQARRRLRAFATCQVALVREGWQIIYAENEEEKLAALFPLVDTPITLVGRIDRIDFHAVRKTIRILDYKTGDNAGCPDKTHRAREKWIDLQLPLYRHLWRATELDVPGGCAIELAYFNLPKQLEDTKVIKAEWNDALLETADEEARRVIRDLRAQSFSGPKRPPPKYSEDLAAICLDNVYAALEEDEGGTDEP